MLEFDRARTKSVAEPMLAVAGRGGNPKVGCNSDRTAGAVTRDANGQRRTGEVQYWSGLVTEVDDMIWQAVHTGFEYFQREAGYTRTGSHSQRVNSRETGQWHEADLAVAHWLQHTSRDGDMQLHVHSQIAHVARTATDGKWRAPDSLGYNEHVGAVGAITAQHLEEALTARFGLEWTARDDGHGFEIKGISGEMMRLFSSRRESITADLRERAKRFDLIFCQGDGAPCKPDAVTRLFKRLAALAGLPVIKLHEGRHSAASLARDAAVDPEIRRRTLGHADAAMTAHYTHIEAEAHQAAAEAVAKLVVGASS
jgi:hypothetical protein